jgi:hypothetical protein
VQFLHGVDGRAHDGPHRRREPRSGKHGGSIASILGMPADRLGEAAGPARIHLDQRHAGHS